MAAVGEGSGSDVKAARTGLCTAMLNILPFINHEDFVFLFFFFLKPDLGSQVCLPNGLIVPYCKKRNLERKTPSLFLLFSSQVNVLYFNFFYLSRVALISNKRCQMKKDT